MNRNHWAIFIDNTSQKSHFVNGLLNGKTFGITNITLGSYGALFSKLALDEFMDEEDRHDSKILTKNIGQSLHSMSSGEQKKALLSYLLDENPDFFVLDNPFDNLDIESQDQLKKTLLEISHSKVIFQIVSRKIDLLPFISNFAYLKDKELVILKDSNFQLNKPFSYRLGIPSPIYKFEYQEVLVQLKDVNVSYGTKAILKKINWTIKKGEFWQLVGKNGSGKTTLLSMITGENPKGYGQELYILGKKKGSGESIWDIKKKIGYYTPTMTDKFTGYHTVENMIISGLNDSIGLYVKPSQVQLGIAHEWLMVIGMLEIKETLFHDLSIGQQRLVMTTRAMVKQPLLLILDEPTAGLDDPSAKLLVTLVNKIATESETAIIFVSHRKEPGLNPDFIYELHSGEEGSTGTIK